MRLWKFALLSASLNLAAWAAPIFNVRDYGAAGDGMHKDTAAIAKTIEACAKAGGGTVLIPAGKYLTGTIQMKSDMTLLVDSGATLLGSDDPADYLSRPNPYGGARGGLTALVYGEDLVNVTITGHGTIDGRGQVWWKRMWLASPKKGMPGAVTPEERAEAAKIKTGRPRLIQLVRCRNVWMEGLMLVNSPSWTINPVFCEYLTITGMTLVNPVPSPNTDGINPESCRNVHIANCHIDVGDDCITLKSGTDALGRKVGKPDENITITNCTMINGHGGVVIGSEMSGGVRNVSVTNCVFQGTDRGIRVKSQRGRGAVVEGLVVDNIVMQDVLEPITITTFYSGSDTVEQVFPVNEGTPQFRDFRISNITARNSKSAGQITGLKEMPIKGIVLSNIKVGAGKGFVIRNAAGISFHNVEINSETGPALMGENVDTLEIDGFRTAAPHADAPVIDLNGVKDVFVRQCWAPRGTATFLRVKGAAPAAGVTLEGNNFKLAKEPVSILP